MQNTGTFDDGYLFELVTFMGMKKLEYLYQTKDWSNLENMTPFFGENGHKLKELMSKPTFLHRVCKAYDIKIVSAFEKLVYKYKKKHLFTNKYNCEDRIIFHVNYVTSYEAVKKASRIRDWDFIHYMLHVRKLKYSLIHLEYLSRGLYDQPQLVRTYAQSYLKVNGEFSWFDNPLLKGFNKACKHGVSVEIYESYLNLYGEEFTRYVDRHAYIIGREHNHLLHFLGVDSDLSDNNIARMALITDNVPLLNKILNKNSEVLGNRMDMIQIAVDHGARKSLNYFNVTKEEIFSRVFVTCNIRSIKYLYKLCAEREKLLPYLLCKKTNHFKVQRFVYKKYSVFLNSRWASSEYKVEFMYNMELIYAADMCNELIRYIIFCDKKGQLVPEIIEIMMKIKDDERVAHLFDITTRQILDKTYNRLNDLN